jgi:uncharacterized protein YjdB
MTTVSFGNQNLIVNAQEKGVEYVKSDFDNYVGAMDKEIRPSGWGIYNFLQNKNYTIGEKVSGRNNISFKMVTSEANNNKKLAIAKYLKKDNYLSGKVVLEVSVMLEDTKHNRSIFEMKSKSKIYGNVVSFSNNGKILVNDNKDIGSYEPNKWYHIKGILDNANKTLDVYINDELMIEKYAYNDKWDAITSFKFSQTGVDSQTGIMYLDDIRVSDFVEPNPIPNPNNELLKNNSFELTEDNNNWLNNKGPVNWWIYNGNQPLPELSLDDKEVKDGLKSVKVYSDTNKRIIIGQNIKLDLGNKYNMSSWVKTKNRSTNSYLRAQIYVAGNDKIIEYSDKVSGDTEWSKLELEVYIPTDATGIKIEHVVDKGTGTVWFDNANIEKLSSIPVSSISLEKSEGKVKVGTTTQVKYTIEPADATNQEVIWKSSDSSIATIDSFGVITGVKEGIANITATTKDGNKSVSYKVTVIKGDTQVISNLIQNSGFELTSNDSNWVNNIGPIKWGVWLPTGKVPLSIDTTDKKEGNQSIKIENTNRRACIGQVIPVEAGKRYDFSCFIKTDNVKSKYGVFVRNNFLNNGTKVENGPITQPLASDIDPIKTYDWTERKLDIKVPAGANQLKMEMFFETGTGIAWFDDLKLVDKGKYMIDLKLDQEYIVLDNNKSVTINPIFTPVDVADTKVTWTSSDESIAKVVEGVVTTDSTNKGLVTIKAITNDGNIEAQCRIFVGKDGGFNVSNINETIDEDSSLIGKVEPKGVEGSTYTYKILEAPNNGIAYIGDNGEYTYYPNKDYNGKEVFKIMVLSNDGGSKTVDASITVNPVNDDPIYQIEHFVTTNQETINDSIKVKDIDKDNITYTLDANATNGNVSLESIGTFTYTPNKDYIGYDSFEVTISDNNGGVIKEKIMVFVQPLIENIKNDFASHGLSNEHPRLLVTKSRINELKSNLQNDDYINKVYNSIKTKVDSMIDMEPTPEDEKSPYKTRNKLVDAAVLYQLTNDPKYAEFVWEELEAVANYKDWGISNSMLGCAETSFYVAFGYDMIYDYLNDQQRNTIENAIKNKALKEYMKTKAGERTNNINFVVNGTMAFSAMAILEDAQELEGKVLERALKDIQLAIRYYSKDGAWPEGPIYWGYGGQYLTYLIASLNNSLGIDYGLSQLEGFKNSGAFPVYLQGELGTFNFADGNGLGGARPEAMWYASHYNKPEYAFIISDFNRRKNTQTGLSLLFYKNGLVDKKPNTLDKTFKVVETSAFRSNWADANALFVAMKGYNSQMKSHADLDSGTFVFDALGVRWAMDLGTDNYSLPGFWDGKYQRWTYYRKKPEGHNTLVINPKENPVLQQDVNAASCIIDTESKPKGAYSILDLSDAYTKDAKSAKRGMKLFNNRSQILIQDELLLKKPSEIYWFMHTRADIEIIENGKAALLTKEGKKLYVKLISNNNGATFKEMEAKPLPTSPNPYPDKQKSNNGIRKLALYMDDVVEETISIWMVPLLDIESIPEDEPVVTPLKDWTIEDGNINTPKLKGINIDGESLSDFQDTNKVFNINLPFGTKKVPVVSVESNHNVSITQASEIPGIATINVNDGNGNEATYYVSFNLLPLIGKPQNAIQYVINKDMVTSSGDDGHKADNTVDGDLNTRWSAKGEQWIKFDLGEQKLVNYLSIAFFSGDLRQTIFDVEVSIDGKNYTKLLSKVKSSGLTSDFETFEIDPTKARYIRINGHGNTVSQWNSISEVEIYSPSKKNDKSELGYIMYGVTDEKNNHIVNECSISEEMLNLMMELYNNLSGKDFNEMSKEEAIDFINNFIGLTKNY